MQDRKKDKLFDEETEPLDIIHKRIEQLAGCYVPEWNYDRVNPDAGSVIARIIAGQIRNNILYFRSLPERYHRELVRMLELSPLPAKPACTTVLFGLTQDTAPGVSVPKGTKLLADRGAREKIVFETVHGIHVTGVRLKTVLTVSGHGGKILLHKGKMKRLTLTGETQEVEQEMRGGFPLFRFDREGIERNALLLYFSGLFAADGRTVGIKIEGCAELTEAVRAGRYALKYYGREGIREVQNYRIGEDGTLYVRWGQSGQDEAGGPGRIAEAGKEYALLVIEAPEPPEHNLEASDITLVCPEEELAPDYIYDGRNELEPERFAPFATALGLYSECYIGQDGCFAGAGAQVRLKMNVSYEEHREGYAQQGPETELKLVKRKPPAQRMQNQAETFAEEITLEYYNGMGWRRLPVTEPVESLFAAAGEGQYEITFSCPQDWKPVQAGGYEGRCIRLRLVKADNCYLRPCVHHYPVISGLRISSSCEGRLYRPDRVVRLAGTKRTDLTGRLKQGKSLTLFSPGACTQNTLLFGFNRRFEAGPVSLYLELEGYEKREGKCFAYEYSTGKGFRTLTVTDHTRQLTGSGLLLFQPPEDMDMLEVEGVSCCWIRIRQLREDSPQYRPCLRSVTLNAAEVRNVDTLREEAYYMEKAEPYLSFPIRAQQILDAQIWVSEEEDLTREEMERLRQTMPERVRVETNDAGEMVRFYVKWEETPSLETVHSPDPDVPGRYYVLDRTENRIRFGDGVHVRIPRNTKDDAFLAVFRCCSGQDGNVKEGAIRESVSNLSFLGSIRNPKPAVGGSNRESVQNVLKRGEGLLGGHNRLISEADYIREAEAFSDAVHQAACVTGQKGESGRREHWINLVLLMKSQDAAFFEKFRSELKEYLISRCEMTVREQDLQIMEPSFAEVSAGIWLEAGKEDRFELTGRLTRKLEEYLDPVYGCAGKGWKIGTMPTKTQIMMQINGCRQDAIVKRVALTVRYQDSGGYHETGLEEFRSGGFYVCRSGQHTIKV